MLVSHFLSEKQAHISVSCWYLLQKLLQRLLAAGKQFVLLPWCLLTAAVCSGRAYLIPLCSSVIYFNSWHFSCFVFNFSTLEI